MSWCSLAGTLICLQHQHVWSLEGLGALASRSFEPISEFQHYQISFCCHNNLLALSPEDAAGHHNS